MTVKTLFGKGGPLEGFKAISSTTLLKFKGKTIAVDLSIFLYQWCSRDEYAIPATSVPRYDSPHLEQEIYKFHNALSSVFSIVVYVYEGKDLPLKNATKLERMQKISNCEHKLSSLLAKQRSGSKLNSDELNDVKKCRRGMSAPDEYAYGKAIRFMKNHEFIAIGAPGEAEHQLVELQSKNIVDLILTKDADLIPLGAAHVLYDLQFDFSKVENSKVAEYKKSAILSPNTNFPSMYLYRNYLPEFATLLGTDYSRRIHNFGPASSTPFMEKYIKCDSNEGRNKMLLELEAMGVIQGSKKNTHRVRADYVAASNHQSFIASLDNSTRSRIKIDASFIGWARKFHPSVAMFRYCPVYKFIGDNIDISKSETFEVNLAPLNPLPVGCTWESMLGFDPPSLINADGIEPKDVVELKRLLRFDGRAPLVVTSPTYSAEENPSVSTLQSLPRYGRLDFDACPVELQPSDILLAWLSARGIHIHSDDRNEIEHCVYEARELECEVMVPDLQPKDNPYHWFDVLEPKKMGNKYDHWNGDWIDLLPRLKTIDDCEFDRIFGKGGNGVRERARGLLFDGNVLMNGIECINVQSRDPNDNSELLLFRTKCVPSMKSTEAKSNKHLFYHVHVCAEVSAEDGCGFFRPCPFSACSCVNGCFYCSHREAVVIGIALAQKYLAMGRLDKVMTYWKCKEDPRLGKGRGVLAENYTLRAKSERSQAQKKRERSNDTPAKQKKQRVTKVTP